MPRFVDQLGGVVDSVARTIDQAESWLTDGPLHLSEQEVSQLVADARAQLEANRQQLAARAFSSVMLVGQIVVGFFVTVVLTFFFVKDGDRLARSLLTVVPAHRRTEARRAASRGWDTMSRYVGGVTIEATIEAVMKAVGLWLLGVPLVLPLAIITFVAAYIPLVGAFTAGLLAAMVALVTKGPATALAVIALALFIQNVAAQLLDPLVMARTTRLHPVAVILALSTGGIVAGLFGAIVAVPITASIAAIVRGYREPDEDEEPPAEHAEHRTLRPPRAHRRRSP